MYGDSSHEQRNIERSPDLSGMSFIGRGTEEISNNQHPRSKLKVISYTGAKDHRIEGTERRTTNHQPQIMNHKPRDTSDGIVFGSYNEIFHN